MGIFVDVLAATGWWILLSDILSRNSCEAVPIAHTSTKSTAVVFPSELLVVRRSWRKWDEWVATDCDIYWLIEKGCQQMQISRRKLSYFRFYIYRQRMTSALSLELHHTFNIERSLGRFSDALKTGSRQNYSQWCGKCIEREPSTSSKSKISKCLLILKINYLWFIVLSMSNQLMANYGEAFDKQFAEMFNESVIIILLLCVRQPANIEKFHSTSGAWRWGN